MFQNRLGRYVCLIISAWTLTASDLAWSQEFDLAKGSKSTAVPVEVRVLSVPLEDKSGEFPAAVRQLIRRVDPSQLLIDGGVAMGADQTAQEATWSTSPTVCLRLSEPEFATFVRQVSDQDSSAIQFAPKLLLEIGQEGSMSDRSARPFVIGFNRVDGDFAAAYQPVVKSFFEGMRVSIRLDSEGQDEFRVAAQFERTRINQVEELELEGSEHKKVLREAGNEYTGTPLSANRHSSNSVTIQIPRVTVLSKSASASLRLDETVLVLIGEWEQPKRVEKGVPIPGGDRLFKRVVLENENQFLILAISPRRPSDWPPSDRP